jgi:hypothetical protein
MHKRPAQQSVSVVQSPPSATHTMPQTYGGVPNGFLVQGKPQQSALDAHALPA